MDTFTSSNKRVIGLLYQGTQAAQDHICVASSSSVTVVQDGEETDTFCLIAKMVLWHLPSKTVPCVLMKSTYSENSVICRVMGKGYPCLIRFDGCLTPRNAAL